MPGVNPPGDLKFFAQFKELQENVRALATQQNAVLSNGDGAMIGSFGIVPGSNPPRYGIVAYSGVNGEPVFFTTDTTIPDGSGRRQTVVYLVRDDGSVALALADNGTVLNHPHQQALQWSDRSGNTVFSDDTVSGVGIATPYLQGPYLANTNTATWPSTAQTTWTAIASAFMAYQQPRVQWEFNLWAPANTTGQFRLKLNNVQVGTTQTVVGGAGGNFASWTDAQPWPSGLTHGDAYVVELDAQVTAGTGTIAAQQIYLVGMQS